MGQKYSRKALANYIAASTETSEQLAETVAAFLIDHGSTSDLDSLMRDVMEVRGRKDGIVELTARSANPITQAIRSEIETIAKSLYPAAREVVIHEEYDKSVIGGARLQFANASLDLTIQSKLNKLREAIT